MVWVLVIAGIILVFTLALNSANKQETNANKELKKQGLSLSSFKQSKGTYAGGHPKADDNFPSVAYLAKEDVLKFYTMPTSFQMPTFKFNIEKNAIKNISIEDASTMENKITLGRVLLVGVFALAWRKKKKNEIAFVVIDWNDGKFDHSTTFSFEGKDAAQEANRFRNQLIAVCK